MGTEEVQDPPPAVHGDIEPGGRDLWVGLEVASEDKGELKTEFKSDTPAIYVRWHGQDLRENAEIRAAFIAESVADVAADYEIDETNATPPKPDSGGTFTLSKPEEGWSPGSYRIEFFVNDDPATTVEFKISK